MARPGLSRGKDGLEVYVMREIPSNTQLARGIDSISLNPDAVLKTTPAVVEMEKQTA